MNEWEWQLLEDKHTVESLDVGGTLLRVGDRVRLRPKAGGDIMDVALAGQTATIEALEQDYEGKQHVCVVLDADPGRDMGLLRQPGHRFFFDPSEIEFLRREELGSRSVKKRILVAGIGNIFLGDDGFGVEVAQRLLQRGLPEAVRVTDFGIRGLDLAYALQDEYEAVILIDAHSRGQEPGTLYLVEPDLEQITAAASDCVVEAHAMDPLRVLRLGRSMGAKLKKVLLIGCEPASLGGDEGHMGLSDPVTSAIEGALQKVEELILLWAKDQNTK